MVYGIAKRLRLFMAKSLVTSAMGLLFLLFIPDNQFNSKWLSKGDRELTIERVRVNLQGIGDKKFRMKQLKEA